MINTATSQPATARYIQLMNQVQAELDALQAKADSHFGTHPDALNWGNVGDLANVLSLLKLANVLSPLN